MTVCTPRASARVRTTAIVCGWHPSAIMNIGVVPGGTFATASVRFIASAAAVASSSREALAIGRAVRSATIVWKLSSASSRPCAISGWYGVYAVYHPGFSTMLRWMTWGVKEWIAHPDVGAIQLILSGETAQRLQHFALGPPRRQRQRAPSAK